jgi:hypothetical protein
MLYDYLNHINGVIKTYNPSNGVLSHFVSLNEQFISHVTKNGFYNNIENRKFVDRIKNFKTGSGKSIDMEMIKKNIDTLADIMSTLSIDAPGTCYDAVLKDGTGAVLKDSGGTDVTIKSIFTNMRADLLRIKTKFLNIDMKEIFEPIDNLYNEAAKIATEDGYILPSIGGYNEAAHLLQHGGCDRIPLILTQQKVQTFIRYIVDTYRDTKENIEEFRQSHIRNIDSEFNSLITQCDELTGHTQQIHTPPVEATKVIDILLSYITTLHSMVEDENILNLIDQLKAFKHLLDNNDPMP